jgi:truncated hemoglobin YjbI
MRSMNTTIKPALEALYTELGSDERVYELMLGFYEAMSRDTMIGFFFFGKDLVAVSRRQAEFMLRAMGVRESYSGKSPAQAHGHLAPILPGFFDRRARILEETLRSQGISEPGIRAWVAFEEAFRDAVVAKG